MKFKDIKVGDFVISLLEVAAVSSQLTGMIVYWNNNAPNDMHGFTCVERFKCDDYENMD